MVDPSATQMADPNVTQETDPSLTPMAETDLDMKQVADANVSPVEDPTVSKMADHGVTQMGDTVPDPANRKPTVHILVISDVVCPWCWIAKRSLEEAMVSLIDKFNFNVQYSPFLLRPKCPPEGVPNEAFNNEEDPRNQHLSAVCREFDLDLTFSCPIVPYSVPALTLRQYVRESDYPNVVQSQVAEKLYQAHFSHGQKLDQDDLLQVAKELMLDVDEVRAYLEDPENTRRVIDQAQAWRERGVQAVPFFYMNGKAVCSGAQDTKNFIQTILKVAEMYPAENMGDAGDLL
ncbi:hypothetical protein EGW08_017621 [Elysia chlorotica]|uniref:DSBA-like thioredoxin domain-containing protein n=1 Tax=Elysia chlorotica TaxID=188477 RepID=A0A3S1B2M2_ELYCH|nr:hypothetical protein EGW08_017621 [Elysia chlorotica]